MNETYLMLILSAAIGAIMPYLLRYLYRIDWLNKRDAKTILTVLLSTIAGFVITLVTGHWSTQDLIGSASVAYTTGQIFYRLHLKPYLTKRNLI